MAATAPAAPADINRFRERKQMTQETPSENFTMIPNGFLDEQLAKIDYVTELKVTLVVIRQTIGYQKRSDIISYSQFEKLTGLSRPSVCDGLGYALARGLVIREQVGQRWRYSLQPVASGYQLKEATSSPRLPEPVAQGYQQPVASGYPQNKGLNKPKNKEHAVSDETVAPAVDKVFETGEPTETKPSPSSRQVEALKPGPVDRQQDRAGAGKEPPGKIHIPAVPKPVPKKKEPDPTLKDPRLLMWRTWADQAEYGPWPNRLQRQMIIDTVPLERMARWEATLKHWVGHGWQMSNVEDQLEVFVTGKRKRGNA